MNIRISLFELYCLFIEVVLFISINGLILSNVFTFFFLKLFLEDKMKKSKKIILGIIGCGTIGKFHLRNIIQNFRFVQVKYICDIDIKNVKNWADKENFDGNIIFTSNYEDILNDNQVNAVIISTHITQHTDILIKAANAGKNIFCEKQIGVDPQKIKNAIDIIKKMNLKLQVGFHRRFDINYIKGREMILKGAVGDIHIVKAITRLPRVLPARYLQKNLFAGHFNEVTSHDFDILRYLTNSEIMEIFAIGKVLIEEKFAEIDDYDTILVSLKFDNDSIGTIDGSMQTTYGFDQRVEIFGSKGCIFIDNLVPTQIFFYGSNGGRVDKLTDEAWSKKQSYSLFYMDRYHDAFIREFKEFFKVIIEDREPICRGIDGIKNILVCDAAKKSADSNMPVKLDYSNLR